MKYLFQFRIGCVLLLIVSVIAVYFEFYVYNLASMTRLYVWAYAAIAALIGNAAAAFLAWWWPLEQKKREKP